jgi:tetratricopeptide (TPR) repeat protein
MLSTSVCIFARPMPRLAMRIVSVLVLVVATTGCEELDGRGANRKGNRLFAEGRFKDAAAHYEKALTKVKDDRIEYNLGLAYSRIFNGNDGLVLLAEKGSEPCERIPGVTYVTRSVCVRDRSEDEDRTYPDCKTDQDCPSSNHSPGHCAKDLELCAIANKQLVDLSAEHLKIWIAKQPPDEEISERNKKLTGELAQLEDQREAAATEAESYRDPGTGKFTNRDGYEAAMRKKTGIEEELKIKREEIEENRLKFTMRTMMTNLYVDSGQPDKALAFWESELKARPNDFEAMGKLAGINLKAGNWRKAIDWYQTIAEKVPEDQNKIAAYSSVGNVAWAKLNSKTLPPDEAVEVADLGIGALQRAAALAPKNAQFLRLQSSLYNFRAREHGVSWAAAIDRASGQDLKGLIDVVSGQASRPAEPPKPAEPGPNNDKPGG